MGAAFISSAERNFWTAKLLLLLKAFIGWVTKGLHKGHALRRDIYSAKTLPEVYGILDTHFETAASEKLMGASVHPDA